MKENVENEVDAPVPEKALFSFVLSITGSSAVCSREGLHSRNWSVDFVVW